MSKVVSLTDKRDVSPDANQESIIELAEEILSRAHNGDFLTLAVAFTNKDGTLGTLWRATGRTNDLAASAMALFRDVIGGFGNT